MTVKHIPSGFNVERYRFDGTESDLRSGTHRARKIIGVDRCDHSRGLHIKLLALHDFLQTHADWSERLVFRQLLARASENTPADRRYRRRVIHFADYLNRKFGNRNWRPVELASAKMPACDLKQFYRDGDIYFIADMNDGMNPEAMAYTVAQNPADPGVLLISRDTGAAQFLAGALQFNPADMASVLRQLKAAVTMSEFERISRWRQNIQWIDSLASSRRDTAGLPAENRFGEKSA